MKKVIFVFVLFLGVMQANAQVDFGVKGGINFNSETFNIPEVIGDFNTTDKMGYHAGIWTRFKLPIIGLYVRPELVYTALQSDINILAQKETYDFKKLDLPVLLGFKMAGFLNIFAGPSFQYILDNDFSFEGIKDVKSDDFTVGMQLGAGVEFGSLGVDVRWERGFSELESKVINTDAVAFDTRINQIILGLSYKF